MIGDMAVRLEGPTEVVDSPAGTGSRAAQHAEARTPVQPSGEIPIRVTGERPSQKNMEGGAPTRTMALETIIPKEAAIGEQQRETQPTRNEGHLLP